MIKGGALPQGMTMEDAMREYKESKTVIRANDGKLKVEGVECVDCHEVHPKEEMIYCHCDEGLVCKECCEHCGFNDGGDCEW